MIIGLTGFARSGKDSVAKVLVDQYGFTRVAFADKIRELLYEINPIVNDSNFTIQGVVNEYGWEDAKVLFPEVRRLLQDLGVGARSLFGDTFWINQAIGAIGVGQPNVVITDVRFKNEADTLKANGAELWRVKRSGIVAYNRHISETDMDGYNVDQVFVNNGSLEDLETLVKTKMKDFT